MKITSLEKMEEIVENNRALSWDGWTVLHSMTNIDGYASKEGVYVKGKWIVQKRYNLTASGWEIPNKFVG
jgi:hypothetical protein